MNHTLVITSVNCIAGVDTEGKQIKYVVSVHRACAFVSLNKLKDFFFMSGLLH